MAAFFDEMITSPAFRGKTEPTSVSRKLGPTSLGRENLAHEIGHGCAGTQCDECVPEAAREIDSVIGFIVEQHRIAGAKGRRPLPDVNDEIDDRSVADRHVFRLTWWNGGLVDAPGDTPSRH